MNEKCLGEIVIRGVTRTGRTFRPSDWAERLAGLYSDILCDRRVCYSPCVQPVSRDGVRCVVVNLGLERIDPKAYQFLMDFARDNDLQIVDGRASPSDRKKAA